MFDAPAHPSALPERPGNDTPDDLFSWAAARSTTDDGVEASLAEAAQSLSDVPILGDVSKSLDSGYAALKRIGMQKADEVIAANAGRMINSIGATVLNTLHDTAMPRSMHYFVDALFGTTWPEIKKSLLDSILLDLGLEFRAMKQWQQSYDPEPPGNDESCFKRAAARFIYAMEPYDLTIWGTIRSPLSLLIQIAFLFPFYAVSDVCVIALAVAKYFTDFNEYGLIQFIVTAKKLQFITSGLISGTIAFTKLFICATLREDASAPNFEPSYYSCARVAPHTAPHSQRAHQHAARHSTAALPSQHGPHAAERARGTVRRAQRCGSFAPGAHATFPFEMAIFIVRSLLLWVAFGMLWNFDAMIKAQRRRKRALESQQRLTKGAERRGLYGPYLTGVLVLLSWQLAIGIVALMSVDVWRTRADHEAQYPRSALPGVSYALYHCARPPTTFGALARPTPVDAALTSRPPRSSVARRPRRVRVLRDVAALAAPAAQRAQHHRPAGLCGRRRLRPHRGLPDSPPRPAAPRDLAAARRDHRAAVCRRRRLRRCLRRRIGHPALLRLRCLRRRRLPIGRVRVDLVGHRRGAGAVPVRLGVAHDGLG